ncbi:MAG: hypothetical protein JWO10_1277 [Microbacteriaceae bacterium]|nr:hypothetical protein [Microbacteriaceae bacterium]
MAARSADAQNSNMISSRFAAIAAVSAVLLLSACSTASSGGSAGSSGTGAAGSGSGTTAGAKLSGDYTGTITPNNCAAAGIMSIQVVIGGTKYNGSLSATQAGFVGPDAVDFVTAPSKDPALPTVSSDGNTFTLSAVHVYDLIGGKSAVIDGTLTCP